MKSIPSLSSGRFIPSILIPGGLLQSVLGSGRTRLQADAKFTENVYYDRELIELPDGGTYSIDWAIQTELSNSDKIMLVIPGLTGGSEAPYIKNPVKVAQNKGFRVGVVHGRGICGTPLTTLQPNYLGNSSDLGFAIEYVHKKFPNAPIVALGTSMGGNLVLKYAGETGEKCLLRAISVISTPFDIVVCSRHLRKNWPKAKLADMYLTKSILNMISKHEEFFETWESKFGINMSTALKIERSFEFDLNVTCKHLGIIDPEEYYKTSSCVGFLSNINIPVFALSSINDPVVSKNCIPYDEFRSNKNLILAVTKSGGHIGWFEGVTKAERWYSHPTIEFLEKILDSNNK